MFDTPAGINAMTGRSHWSGDLSAWVTDNGKAHQNALYGGEATALFGDSHFGDTDVTFDYETGGSDVDGSFQYFRQTLRVWQKDASNYIQIALDTDNKRVQVGVTVSGSNTNYDFLDQHGSAGGAGNVAILPAGKLRVQIRSARLKIWIDGTALAPVVYSPPWDSLDLTGVPVDNRQGLVGAAQGTYRWPVMSAIAVRAADIVCDSIDGAVGRKAYSGAGASVGTVTYSGRYAGTPVTWISRLLDASDPDGPPVRDWQAVTATAAAGIYSVEEDLPIGGPYVIEHGYLDGSGLRHSCLSPPTLVGYRIVTYGQSTSLLRGAGGGQSFASLPAGAIAADPYNASGAHPAGYMANGRDPYVTVAARQGWGFANPAQQITGKPIVFESYGVPGATISTLMSGTGNWTDFANALATRKGVIECLIWDQGQGDADVDGAAFPANLAAYPTRFNDGIVSPFRSLTGNAALPILMAHMGRWAAASPPAGLSSAEHDDQRDRFRRMQYALTAQGGGADANIHTAEHHNGVLYADNYHPSTSGAGGNDRINERSAWCVAKHVFGQNVHSGRGPTPESVTRSGANLHISMGMNGAGSLSELDLTTNSGSAVYPAQPANRFKGWDFSTTSDFASLLAVTSITASGSGLDVVLAADPGAPVHVRHLHGANYRDNVLFCGIYSGAANDHVIPVEPVMNGNGYLLSN